MSSIKDKIIKLLGGYTLKEYHDAAFAKTKPNVNIIGKFRPVTINVELNTDPFIIKDTEQLEERVKLEIAAYLARQIIDNKSRFIMYQSENDPRYNQKIIKGTITVMELESEVKDNEI